MRQSQKEETEWTKLDFDVATILMILVLDGKTSVRWEDWCGKVSFHVSPTIQMSELMVNFDTLTWTKVEADLDLR